MLQVIILKPKACNIQVVTILISVAYYTWEWIIFTEIISSKTKKSREMMTEISYNIEIYRSGVLPITKKEVS